GCPVPKVTRRGGGGVLPWKTELFTRIVSAAVEAAGPEVPVTVKTRIGIDDEHQTFRDAGLIAQEVGAAAIALHGRTVVQHYSGQARWQAITELKELVTDIPVLGNGDIWSAEDAIEMMEQTGCDGVVVGRGCQGRPWLFADRAAGLPGKPDRVRPTLPELAGASPYPGAAVEGPRGRAGTPKKAHVPEGWMTSRELSTEHAARLHEAELDTSGG